MEKARLSFCFLTPEFLNLDTYIFASRSFSHKSIRIGTSVDPDEPSQLALHCLKCTCIVVYRNKSFNVHVT